MMNFSHLSKHPVLLQLRQFPVVARAMPTVLAGCYLAYAMASTGGKPFMSAAGAPAPVAMDSQSESDEIAVDFAQIGQWHLFGQPQVTVTSSAVATETQLPLKLLGTFVLSAAAASAVIQAEDGSQKKYKIGDELPGGAVLTDIRSTRVLLSHNSRREVLALQRQSIVSAPSAEQSN